MYSDVIEAHLKKLADNSILNDISKESNRIELNDWLLQLCQDIESVNKLSFKLVKKNSGIYLLYKFKDTSGDICRGGIKIEGTLVDTVKTVLELIVKGQMAIDKINSRLDTIKVNNGIILSFKYKFGLGKTCRIAYWDYNTIVIYSSEAMMKGIIGNTTYETIDEYIDKLVQNTVWSSNVAEFIKEFNGLNINVKTQGKLDASKIAELLEENMLVTKNVADIVLNNSNKHGTQKIKSVKTVDSQLGLFAAVMIWNIDYEICDISVDIIDDKVIDLENNRFISDHSLYSRIEQIIHDEADEVTKKFKELAS